MQNVILFDKEKSWDDNKEVIVDDNPDMRNAFLPKSLKITARLLEIFCSC